MYLYEATTAEIISSFPHILDTQNIRQVITRSLCMVKKIYIRKCPTDMKDGLLTPDICLMGLRHRGPSALNLH